ncbi:MAG: type II toxin-antitoxin system RelE/ParE family toxin [Alphaproteobacteria bacterium]
MRVEWQPHKSEDLLEIAEYISDDDPDAARRVIGEIVGQVEIPSGHPLIGRPGRLHGVRELIVNRTPYTAAYKVQRQTVFVLRVFHRARRWPRRL